MTSIGKHLSMEVNWQLVMCGPYRWLTSCGNVKYLYNLECSIWNNQNRNLKDKQKQPPPYMDDLTEGVTKDWRQPYIEYLTCKNLFNQK